ncbi:MAG: glycosyltransferase family 4 protein [Thermoanaerobaculia bacterium]|nr:glycosyltransferase family 4 protein [Thermoanaerobaculia bacterium]
MTRGRVLIVSGRPPWPPWRGDPLRTRQWVEALRKDYDVTVLTPRSSVAPDYADWPDVRHLTFRPSPGPIRLVRALFALASGLPAQCGMYHYPELRRALGRLVPQHDVAVLLLARLALHADDLGDLPWIADLVDALSLNFQRRAEVDHPLFRPLLELEARLLARAEETLISRSRRTLVVSDRDAEYLADCHPEFRDRISVVPVAAKTPSKVSMTHPSGSRETATIAFTGNLGYFVNRDGLNWWIEEVWPRLRQERPDLRLLVAGDRPPRSLRRQLRRAGGELIARPENLLDVLAPCTLAIAPLRCGAGMPLKILDAWAVGVPVVASPWAAAGVAAADGGPLRVAETPAEWSREILELLDSPSTRRELASKGRERLERDFSRQAVFVGLRDVVALIDK